MLMRVPDDECDFVEIIHEIIHFRTESGDRKKVGGRRMFNAKCE